MARFKNCTVKNKLCSQLRGNMTLTKAKSFYFKLKIIRIIQTVNNNKFKIHFYAFTKYIYLNK